MINLPNFLCCNVMVCRNCSKKVLHTEVDGGRCGLVRGWRVLLAKPTNRQVIVYIQFFMYGGYDILLFCEAHCISGSRPAFRMRFFATNFGGTMSWGAKPCFSASKSGFMTPLFIPTL